MGAYDHVELLVSLQKDRRAREQYFDGISRFYGPIFSGELKDAFHELDQSPQSAEIVITKMDGRMSCVYRHLVD